MFKKLLKKALVHSIKVMYKLEVFEGSKIIRTGKFENKNDAINHGYSVMTLNNKASYFTVAEDFMICNKPSNIQGTYEICTREDFDNKKEPHVSESKNIVNM